MDFETLVHHCPQSPASSVRPAFLSHQRLRLEYWLSSSQPEFRSGPLSRNGDAESDRLTLLEGRLVFESPGESCQCPSAEDCQEDAGVEHMWVYHLLTRGILVRGCLKGPVQDMGLYIIWGGGFKEK